MPEKQNKTIRFLLEELTVKDYQLHGTADRLIENITWDYQKVTENTLYFCVENEEFQENHIEGTSLDYWETAVKAGAVCLVAENGKIKDYPDRISLIEVDNVNHVMAMMARAFHDNPLGEMKLIGITGTNGKTTTSQLIDSVLIQSGNKTGVIGTIGVFYPSGKEEASHLSNPMATEVFSIAAKMQQEGVNSLTMEVTSHAGAFDRNHALDFDVAVFTNLTQDHLDYHKTIDAYKKCKLRHFQQLGTKKKKAYGVINVDDISGQEFVDAIDSHLKSSGKAEVLTYGIRNKNADLVAYPRQMTGVYSEFDIFLKGNHLCQVHLPMPGLFNIYNSLAAFGATFAMGISIDDIVEGLKNASRVDGRFERVECDANFEVYVDYAHTPDSLEKILQEIKGLTKRNLIAVFGCGGDRDRSKRPVMGEIGARLADICVITSDNPRSEDPNIIIKDIVEGIPENSDTELIVEPDRRQAIYTAMEIASGDDSVLIAGKGHEDYQIIGTTRHSFLDRKVVQEFFHTQQNQASRAWIEIDRESIKRNQQLFLKDKPAELAYMAVVKDDAMGHGIVETAQDLVSGGCSYLAVSCLSEAIALRREFKDIPILVFGERSEEELPRCIRLNLTLQIQSFEKAKLIGDLSALQNKVTKVHFKVDTGMGRYGVRWDSAVDEYLKVNELGGIEIEGLMTHFAQSDESIKDHANLQWERFSGVVEQLKSRGILPKYYHACNSGGYLDLPLTHGNLVRIGALFGGVYPSKVCRRIDIDGKGLTPAMSVFSCVSFIKQLQPGDKLGYGMHFTADQETRVAVLPIGYGDGYPRLRNKGHVLINGEKAPIIGGNAMDATMVDISSIPNVSLGDRVVLMGKQGNQEISAMMLADWAGTVTYEILSCWTRRIDRLHV